jgi:hypothetical protein
MAGSDIGIFFAFPDGALAYDCAGCDQRCCKTGGLVVFPGERALLVRRHPALELVGAPEEGIAVYATPPSGCWFLSGGRCSLLGTGAAEHNTRHAPPRPVACTLFPFNLFGNVGNTLVVAPNGLCPLHVRPGAGVAHADILDLLTRVGAAGTPPAPLRTGDDAVMALEQLLRDAAAASLEEPSPLPLLAFSYVATERYLTAGPAGLADLDLAHLLDLIGAYDDLLAEYAAVLGVPKPGADTLAAIAPLFAAWSSTVRLFGFGHLPLRLVPRAMLALVLHVGHWVEQAKGRAVLPQTLLQMVSSLGPTLELLATWHEPWSGATVPGVTRGVAPAGTVTLATDPVERGFALRRLAGARREVVS